MATNCTFFKGEALPAEGHYYSNWAGITKLAALKEGFKGLGLTI